MKKVERKPPAKNCKPFSTAAVSAGSVKTVPARRLRLPDRLPVPVGSVPYANRREELKQMTSADHVLLLQATDAWQQVMVPLCQQIDAERSNRGLKFLYTSEELELFLVYGRTQGLKSIKEIRASLAGDMALRERRQDRDVPAAEGAGRLVDERDDAHDRARTEHEKAHLVRRRRSSCRTSPSSSLLMRGIAFRSSRTAAVVPPPSPGARMGLSLSSPKQHLIWCSGTSLGGILNAQTKFGHSRRNARRAGAGHPCAGFARDF